MDAPLIIPARVMHTDVERTAYKDHTCALCPNPTLKGDRYLDTRAKFIVCGKASCETKRYHLLCMERWKRMTGDDQL